MAFIPGGQRLLPTLPQPKHREKHLAVPPEGIDMRGASESFAESAHVIAKRPGPKSHEVGHDSLQALRPTDGLVAGLILGEGTKELDPSVPIQDKNTPLWSCSTMKARAPGCGRVSLVVRP